jgi:hypothetical protein
MDVEGLLQSVVRFSNFMTARLIVSGLVFYVLSGFTDIGSTTEGFLPDLELLNSVIANYQTIFDILGVSEFALLLIFFLFLTAIHITYVAFERVGDYIPPAIVPLDGWTAIEDLTSSTFDILRDARGEEHSESENQRLFEFRRKLEEIGATVEAKYAEGLATTYAIFRVSKSFIVFTTLTWLYAVASGNYTGDKILLLAILGLSLLTAVYATFAISRAQYERIEELRTEVSHQVIGFAAIWTSPQHQKLVAAACVPSRDLAPASFEVLMPIYGTFDDFVEDLKKWRTKPAKKTQQAPPPRGRKPK